MLRSHPFMRAKIAPSVEDFQPKGKVRLLSIRIQTHGPRPSTAAEWESTDNPRPRDLP
jgi:hypothetical protein